MKKQDIIMANTQELKKLHIVKMFIEKKIDQKEAASLLGLSTRQVRRIASGIKNNGDGFVTHKARGKPSNNSKSESLRQKVLKLYSQKYYDFGPTLATEKLDSLDGIKIGIETLRRWLIASGIYKRKRKRSPFRKHRDRKACFGQMLQMDGSNHYWFEDRAGTCTLMAYIDDATGHTFGRFYAYEGTMPAMDSFKTYIMLYGLPASIYFDRHTTYKSTAKPKIEDELAGRISQSQFERALSELGVQTIYANSPQAKGRIERLFGVFQDRLVKELRLAGINTIVDANFFLSDYLPGYNKKFNVVAANDADMHIPLPDSINLDKILCIKNTRTVGSDNTILYKGRLYQIYDNLVSRKVSIEERIDKNMYIIYDGKELVYDRINKAVKKITEVKKESLPKITVKPKPDHPWRSKIKGRGILAIKI